MSNYNKKDTSFTSSTTSKDNDNHNKTETSTSFNSSTNTHHDNNQQQGNQELNRALDETKNNIQRNTDEARSQIPRYTQTVNEVQEQTIQATKDIADNFIDYQKEAINSIQSSFSPLYENANYSYWNNMGYTRRLSEVYARVASNYVDNTIALSRLYNNTVFANIDAFKNVINNAKESSKQLTEIGRRNAKVYEQISRDTNNSVPSVSTETKTKTKSSY